MKIRVGVFFGGKSVEHEISVISAIQAIGYMNKEKYDIIPIYITKKNEFYVGEDIGKIEAYKDVPALIRKSTRIVLVPENGRVNIVAYPVKLFGKKFGTIDIAFPIVHGTNVEDGSLQGYFKTLNLPFVGCDVMAAAAGMDKYVTKAILKDNGVPVLDCRCYTAVEFAKEQAVIDDIESRINYPVIVKPLNLGSSIGIKKATDRDSLVIALETAFSFAGVALVERCIDNLREINCSVLGDCDEAIASECEEPIAADEILSYEDKYVSNAGNTGSKGMASTKRLIPAPLSPERREEIRNLAIKAFKCIGCNGVCRIDFMIDKDTDRIYLNELNTIPGSLAFYLWEPIGIKYTELLDRMLELTLKKMRKEEEITYAFDTNVLQSNGLLGAKGGCKA